MAAGIGRPAAGTNTRALAAFFAAVAQGMSVQATDGASVQQLRQIAAEKANPPQR